MTGSPREPAPGRSRSVAASRAALASVGVDPAAVPGRVQEIWLAYFEGEPLAALALRFGMSRDHVEALFAEYGLPGRRSDG